MRPIRSGSTRRHPVIQDHSGRLPDRGDAFRVVGRIRLKRCDVRAAADHVIASANTPGSPTLSTFGPSMALADDLLKAGHRQVVLEDLVLCGRFWSPTDGRLKNWVESIRTGGTPYFGGNLVF